MKVKVCGITRLEDALAAVEAGVDLLGFNFYRRSPRYVEPETCAAIVEQLRALAAGVVVCGVFVNAEEAEVRAIAAQCGLDLRQLHGDEPPEIVRRLGRGTFKAVRPRSAAEAELALASYGGLRAEAPALLVDAYRPGAYGGTGAAADWSLAAGLAARAPILLAGGLTPENVGDAIGQVQPWGVDVASGVESEPGRKDRARMRKFVAAVRRAERELEVADSNG